MIKTCINPWDFKYPHKKWSALAPKCRVYNWLYAWDFEQRYWHALLLLQNEINQQISQIADLRANLKTQQAKTTKARDDLKTALTTMEQLKEWFKAEQANWDTEKAGLVKRGETAEAALEPVKEELSGLKRQINAMTSAIFGK